MPLLKIGGAGTAKPDVEVDNRVEFQVNRNLTQGQKDSGVIAKVQIRHPAFSCIATVWDRGGRKSVTVPQQASSRNDKTNYYPLVNLNKEVRDLILYMVENGEETDNSAWYLEMVGPHTIKITDEDNNEDLGILSIIADGNLSNKQVKAGMLGKVNIITTIGTLYSYTIWNSKFGQSLYGTPPNEGGNSTEDGQRNPPAYRLSREATAQVLCYLHKNMDWNAEREIKEDPAANAPSGSTTNPAGFTPVGDDVVFNGDNSGDEQ
jgi:hypothetical protein